MARCRLRRSLRGVQRRVVPDAGRELAWERLRTEHSVCLLALELAERNFRLDKGVHGLKVRRRQRVVTQ